MSCRERAKQTKSESESNIQCQAEVEQGAGRADQFSIQGKSGKSEFKEEKGSRSTRQYPKSNQSSPRSTPEGSGNNYVQETGVKSRTPPKKVQKRRCLYREALMKTASRDSACVMPSQQGECSCSVEDASVARLPSKPCAASSVMEAIDCYDSLWSCTAVFDRGCVEPLKDVNVETHVMQSSPSDEVDVETHVTQSSSRDKADVETHVTQSSPRDKADVETHVTQSSARDEVEAECCYCAFLGWALEDSHLGNAALMPGFQAASGEWIMDRDEFLVIKREDNLNATSFQKTEGRETNDCPNKDGDPAPVFVDYAGEEVGGRSKDTDPALGLISTCIKEKEALCGIDDQDSERRRSLSRPTGSQMADQEELFNIKRDVNLESKNPLKTETEEMKINDFVGSGHEFISACIKEEDAPYGTDEGRESPSRPRGLASITNYPLSVKDEEAADSMECHKSEIGELSESATGNGVITAIEGRGRGTHCDQSFIENSQLMMRVKSHTKEKAFPCSETLLEESKKSSLKLDKKVLKSKKSYECTECGKIFIRRSHLAQHQQIHTGERPYQCTECEKTFNRSYNLYQHLKLHNIMRLYHCMDCDERFSQRSDLINHRKIHAGERPYECTWCKKRFVHVSVLIIHQRSHTGEKPYECTECKKCLQTATQLKRHQSLHTGEKPFECTECKRSFRDLSTLRNHQTIHTGENPYECTVCEKRLQTYTHLRIHQRIHTGERPYGCTECKKSFQKASNLASHQRLHTGEKPYECAECGKRFNTRSHMKTHQTSHTGERLYQCTECEKSFTQRGSLIQHQKIHSGERPFQCTECEKSFTRKGSLIEHQRSHTGERPYQCTECGKCYAKKVILQKHQKIHSGTIHSGKHLDVLSGVNPGSSGPVGL
ncbi:zinc finger protein 16-like [Ambystoma mexicanum]|uniref:zinc finger protein 16-like n=1 Tax=Ambystoma mexicanum TaxID=8296 RepID=UPI0037E8D830